MSVILFLAVLFILVLVHELGHFAVAKWAKMRVDEFGIGFPPKLFGIKKGETEYTFNIFPIGGFVKIFGEDGVGDASARPVSTTSEQGTEGGHPPEDMPAALSGEHMSSEDKGTASENDYARSFTSKSKWAQAAVLIAGVTMNIIFAWFLMIIVFNMGVMTPVSESEASPEARLTVTTVLENSPAEEASLSPGLIIESVQTEDERLEHLTPTAFSTFVVEHAGEPMTMTYTHEGEVQTTRVVSQTGLIELDPSKPAIGVALAQIDVVKRPLPLALKEATLYTIGGLRDITVGISKLLFDAVRLRADLSQVAGPVGIVGLVGEASAYGLSTLLMFTAFISLNLAIINILPFPALDGGRLLLVGIEAVRRKPISPKLVGAFNGIGFLLLILLMLAVTWNDIVRLM